MHAVSGSNCSALFGNVRSLIEAPSASTLTMDYVDLNTFAHEARHYRYTVGRLPAPIAELRGPITYRRGLKERDAKTLAKSLTKQHRNSTFEAVRVGRSWDVIRRTYR